MKLSALKMENIKGIQNHNLLKNQKYSSDYYQRERSKWIVWEKTFSEILTSEGSDHFVDYIECLGFKNDPSMVVLSSKHHYYYDPEELRNVNTIVNLKEFNQINQIKNFIRSVCYSLKQSGNFIGFFTDNTQHNGFMSILNSFDYKAIGTGIVSRNSFLKMIYDKMESGITMYMSKKSVRQLLEQHGFKVLDMTDHNGKTYFHAQIIRTIYN